VKRAGYLGQDGGTLFIGPEAERRFGNGISWTAQPSSPSPPSSRSSTGAPKSAGPTRPSSLRSTVYGHLVKTKTVPRQPKKTTVPKP
jgi:hypothetical protein